MALKLMSSQGTPLRQQIRVNGEFASADQLRTTFALAMSYMYRTEVPLYGDLVSIVEAVNKQFYNDRLSSEDLQRLTLERHGAIRLGLPQELQTIRRIFALLGMRPVGYYDLSAAGLPMHATCFRPIERKSLATNPFRVFTTLLRPELVRSREARDLALRLLSQRTIFSAQLMDILVAAEIQGGLLVEQSDVFIREALKTFSWASAANATAEEYELLRSQHPVLADIACFQTAHINHLTPRTLDIDLAQAQMRARGMQIKDRVEGPPERKCPILLRQTSFLALQETIKFKGALNDQTAFVKGLHKARFGEVEQRGAAVTEAGRKLYDELLEFAMRKTGDSGPEELEREAATTFKAFPDNWVTLRWKDLVYFEYMYTGKVPFAVNAYENVDCQDRLMIEQLIEDGFLTATPITYEDFLPLSAAGIFQSNLDSKLHSDEGTVLKSGPDEDCLEKAMGVSLLDPDVLYRAIQSRSLGSSLRKLQEKARGV